MDRIQNEDGNDVIKAPPNLINLPEDVTTAIIVFIMSWADVEGSEEEREKARL